MLVGRQAFDACCFKVVGQVVSEASLGTVKRNSGRHVSVSVEGLDAGALCVFEQAKDRSGLSNRTDLLCPFFLEFRRCGPISVVARALYFGVGILVVISLLLERRPVRILELQSLVARPMVFR